MNHFHDTNKHHYKRTIYNNKKLKRRKLKNNSKEKDDNLCTCECDSDCNIAVCLEDVIDELPDVTNAGSKMKWIQRTCPSSRYHTQCKIIKTEPKFKRQKVKIHKTLQSACACSRTKPKVKRINNECYCHEPLEKPLLPIKPAITKPNTKVKHKRISQGNILHNIAILHKAKELLQDYVPKSAFLKSLQKEAKEVYDCQCTSCKSKEKSANLKYTKYRKLLEDAYKEIEYQKQLDDIENRFHKCDLHDACTSPKCSRSVVQEEKLTKTEVPCSEKIQEVKQIREDNYFDTHFCCVKDVPPHKCIHKFMLDDRLLAKPLNADNFGVSRCVICNKAMENIAKKDYTSPKKPRETKKVFPKAALISPRKINFVNRNDIVQLNVPSICINDQTTNIVKNMKAAPANSWALRYQKGVV